MAGKFSELKSRAWSLQCNCKTIYHQTDRLTRLNKMFSDQLCCISPDMLLKTKLYYSGTDDWQLFRRSLLPNGPVRTG